MSDLIHPDPHPRAHHETREARASYADSVRRAGLDTALHLIDVGRPGSALRVMAGVVEAEMAIAGLSGIRIAVSPGMARLSTARSHRKVAGR